MKFTTERDFRYGVGNEIMDTNEPNHRSSDDETFGIEPLENAEAESVNAQSHNSDEENNTNQNAQCDREVHEEGEASDSESSGDLRTILNAKVRSGTTMGVRSKLTVKTGRPKKEEKQQSSEPAKPVDNEQFKDFMNWMDQYKQFKEWEASKAGAGQTGSVISLHRHDKAIQSPSESTVYTRLCKSLQSGLNEPQDDFNLRQDSNEQLIVEKVDCSSTASTIDDYANVDESQIDELILEARKAASASARTGGRKRPATMEQHGNPAKKLQTNTPGTSCGPEASNAGANFAVVDTSDEDDDEHLKRIAAEQESKARRDKILLDAELHRAQLLQPGKCNLSHLIYDAKHKSLGSHVDKAMQIKIVKNEYIELKDLLPPRRKGRRFKDSKPAMHLINEGGHSKWVKEDDDSFISSYKKWEEAFEIYASIYIKGYPHRANELYDYKHCIRDAANTYIWENVFDYDVEFRLHMASCKGNRSWSAKLDYEYSRFMKNLIQFRHDSGHGQTPANGGGTPATHGNNRTREICRRYNKGRCSWGDRCRYLHICSVCKKRGHGAVICRSDKSRVEKQDRSNESQAGHTRTSASNSSISA